MRVPSPTVPPSEGSGPPATPSAPDPAPRRRRMGLVALAAAALAAVVLLGALALDRIPGRNDQAGGRTPGSSPSASGGATASPSENAAPGPGTTSPTTPADDAGDDSSGSGPGEDDGGTSGSGSGGNSGSGNGSGSGSGRVPSGFEAYTDRTGFSLVVPRGWTVRREGTNVFFRRPSGRAYLQVAQTTTPEADVLKDWQDQARGAPGRFPDYELVRLRRVEYKGWDAADWEFTWRASGGRLHVIDRNIRVNDRRAYALYWSVPQEEWGDRQKDFRTIADSFRPAR